jgi:RimK family alpha-L-glutamate ligase
MSTMRVAVLGEPRGWHVGRLAAALRGRGHAVDVVRWAELTARIGGGSDEVEPEAVARADVVAVRGMPGGADPRDRLEEIVFRMDVLGRLAARGTPVVNGPRALETAIDKYLSLARLAAVGLPVPRTVVVQSTADAERAFDRLGGDCVAKPLFGSRGRGIERLRSRAGLTDWLTAAAERPAAVRYLQEFVAPGGWDARLMVVGTRVFAMRRTAAAGEWRTNLALGGRGEPFDPPGEWAAMAVRAAAVLEADVLGVDIAPTRDGGGTILETNAVPGWRGLESATGVDVAGAVAEHLENRRAATRTPGNCDSAELPGL